MVKAHVRRRPGAEVTAPEIVSLHLNPNPNRYEIVSELVMDAGGGLLIHDRLRRQDATLHAVRISENKRIGSEIRREFSRLAATKHPLLTRILDYGEVEGGAFYTQELADGLPITEIPLAGDDQLLFRVILECVETLAERNRSLMPVLTRANPV